MAEKRHTRSKLKADQALGFGEQSFLALPWRLYDRLMEAIGERPGDEVGAVREVLKGPDSGIDEIPTLADIAREEGGGGK